jgi:hypothetical protein
LNELNDHQRQNLTDEIRRTVGSSSVDNLIRYVSQENDLTKNIQDFSFSPLGDEW